jgi:hypothetical protein
MQQGCANARKPVPQPWPAVCRAIARGSAGGLEKISSVLQIAGANLAGMALQVVELLPMPLDG